MPPAHPPHRYLIVDDYGNVTGTNDPVVARQAFFDGSHAILDCHNGESFEEPDEDTTGDIRFVRIPTWLEPTP